MGSAPSVISDLVERFERNLDSYRRPGYNETHLRLEFINPFFKALGWDVTNEQGVAEAYKDVIHEDAITVGGTTKAPDYCFRIGGARKFFLEAKKPAIDLKNDPAPAYQLRRYAWSAKLPLSVLTDFEEFAAYDCRIRPKPADKPSTDRVHYWMYKEYLTKWDEIAAIYSKEAVLKGSFDKYAASPKKRGTTTVDDEFLDEIEQWRDHLAKNLARLNPRLSVHDLNFAVQRTIDRIIFLRICEDRGTEPPARLQALLNGEHTYEKLKQLYDQADDRYNSGLFHFRPEKDRAEAPDELTLKLKVDDKVLKDIIKRLYYPDSPYEFSVFPVEILGQVYEQFLGKVIRLTPGHQAKVEEKPEVKKAGGVYYTPAYIVDYIVRQTVGRLCEGKSPKQIEKLHILDPACGSGSFLIGAYDYLMTYHRDWYVKDGADKHRKELYRTAGGDWRLTTQEKKRILLKNIYGVDIDPQAVEVTKLSLLLKVLEGENDETLRRQLSFVHERALPDLGRNIKCGNSLIGPDYFSEQLLPDEDEMRRINPFDWNAGFSEVMQAGGFDVVIGNPPYGFHQIHRADVKDYFKGHFTASHGSFEHYFLFYEASLKLLRRSGTHGFIVPVTWLTIPSAHSLRKFILENFAIHEIAWLPELVFANAQVNTLISVIARTAPGKVRVNIYDSLGFQKPPIDEFTTDQSRFIKAGYIIRIFEKESDAKLMEKIVAVGVPLDSLARPCSGYNPYEVGKGERPGGGPHDKRTVEEKPYHSTKKKGKLWKREIVGRDLGRYSLSITGKRWIKYGPWLAAPRDPGNFTGKRILVQEITGGKERRIIASYYEGELYHSRDVIPVKCDGSSASPLYLLGIVNSRLITWYHHRRNPKSQKALFPKVLVSDIERLPIHPINFSDSADTAKHDEMVSLVERMLDLHKRLAAAKNPNDKTRLQSQIDGTDREIDHLIYDLYGLSEEEIRIVEGKTL
jgi:type I restriction-modification system DNA methylase subunit